LLFQWLIQNDKGLKTEWHKDKNTTAKD